MCVADRDRAVRTLAVVSLLFTGGLRWCAWPIETVLFDRSLLFAGGPVAGMRAGSTRCCSLTRCLLAVGGRYVRRVDRLLVLRLASGLVDRTVLIRLLLELDPRGDHVRLKSADGAWGRR